MRNKVLAGLTLGAVVLALLPAGAQRGSGTMTLTADDHMQIQQLVTQSGYALYYRHEQPAILEQRHHHRDRSRCHSDVLRGALCGRPERQAEHHHAHRPVRGHVHEDVCWLADREARFLSGHHDARGRQGGDTGAAGLRWTSAALIVERQRTGTPTALTALDYLEIQRLVASYGHALDNGLAQTDNGPAYAGLFTPDGVAFRRLKGFEPLAAIARAQPHGPDRGNSSRTSRSRRLLKERPVSSTSS